MRRLKPDIDSRSAETIGERLRRLRVGRGLSQRDLAGPGVSYAYISRIEAGARRPSVKALRVLARKLGVSPDYLETGSEIRDVEARELRVANLELQLRLEGDTKDIQAALEALLREALEAGDRTAAFRARAALGLAIAHEGRHRDAIPHLEQAIEAISPSPAVGPDLYTTLARSYAAAGMTERSVELLERCLRDIEDEPETATAYIRFSTYLSYALSDLGDLERAQSVVMEALARAGEAADPYTRVRLYWSLARLASMQGEDARAPISLPDRS
jgi:transcriptional regulator with XRE-family HTH domain